LCYSSFRRLFAKTSLHAFPLSRTSRSRFRMHPSCRFGSITLQPMTYRKVIKVNMVPHTPPKKRACGKRASSISHPIDTFRYYSLASKFVFDSLNKRLFLEGIWRKESFCYATLFCQPSLPLQSWKRGCQNTMPGYDVQC